MEKLIANAIIELIKKAETSLPKDVEKKLREAYKFEKNKLAKIQLEQILKNVKFARKESLPICQDTGLLTFYVKIGERTKIKISTIEKIIREAVKTATKKIPLRENLVNPLSRKFSANNIGFRNPKINFEFLPKKKFFEVILIVKGAGSENMSSFAVLKPTENKEEIKNFILEKVSEKAVNACPPIILGIGIGGTSEQSMELSKIALLRKLNERNKNKKIAKFEEKILKEVNKLNIGVMGLGGKTTCLSVNIETADTHIASLPVAINFGCWATRRASVRIF